MSATWKSRIPELAAGAEARAGLAVQKTVLDIEAGAKMRSRVDTGQMKGGWQGEMTGATSGRVSDPVEHTIYNEMGTVSMAAQPMLTPAAEEARAGFEAAMSQVYS
jgi:hypothetical protein